MKMCRRNEVCPVEAIIQNYNVCMKVGRLLYCFANEREVVYTIPMTSVALPTLVDNIFASSDPIIH